MTFETEFSGKDIEEAIKIACESMNLPREQLNIKISSPGTAGIFGLLRKKAVISVSPKDPSAADLSPRKRTSDKGKTPATIGGKKHKSTPSVRHKVEPSRSGAKISIEDSRTPAKEVSKEIMEEIKGSTEQILSLMGCSAEVSLSEDMGKVLVQISGSNLENIIGEEGNTLDALQYLVRKIVSQKFSEKIMLSMDAGDFRETRKNELQELALEMARIVKEGKKYRIIAPLNPAERRIIHVTLQTDTTIRSKSIGEGLFKKIKIYLPGQGRKSQRKRRPNPKPQDSKKL